MKELYIYGNEDYINKVVDYIKEENMFRDDKLIILDLSPELTEDYIEEHGIER